MVVTHEMGHLFGSLHTQNCEWIGGPIDNCASPEEDALLDLNQLAVEQL